MPAETALLTFGIGPVHAFIAQARRVADVWAGSHLLSHLMSQAVRVVLDEGGTMIFPAIDRRQPDERSQRVPDGLPNRFVCRVPAARAEAVAILLRARIDEEWDRLVRSAVAFLEPYGLGPSEAVWTPGRGGRPRQTDGLIEVAWSWVPERHGYAAAAREGARRWTAMRRFRPFVQVAEEAEKCAICGERTALPAGRREHVHWAWEAAQMAAEADPDGRMARFLRFGQGRLCLVCATKRLYPLDQGWGIHFKPFDAFYPTKEAAYVALVKLDGDRMGSLLSPPPGAVADERLEAFHRELSRALSGFAAGLRQGESAAMDLAALGVKAQGPAPQLVYAGGDDVLFVCDPRDALGIARAVRQRYAQAFDEARALLAPAEEEPFTISAAVLFAHVGQPAGLVLHDLEELLDEGAKTRAGRDAVAIRLAKRSGEPVEVAFKWEWLDRLDDVAGRLRQGDLSSRQTFTLRLEEQTLQGVFTDIEQWQGWLADRLGRGETPDAAALAGLVAPFLHDGYGPALRVARFLGREVER